MMCRVCDVSTAGYYAWKKRLNTPPAVSTPRGRRAVITRRVVELFHRHHGFAGARTLWRDLRHEGIEVTVYGVRKIMAEQKLFTKYRTLRKRTTIPDPGVCKRKDLVHRNFSPAVPTTALCGDITYLRTPQGWMYLAMVMDMATRMIVGWQIADRMTTTLITDALDMAYRRGFVADNAIFHSDRGSQYTSQEFARYARSIGVRLSVGKTGICWDNAVAESFFSTLKLHLLWERKQFPSKQDACFETGRWIETYYNRARIHSATDQIPAEAMSFFLSPPQPQVQAA